MYREFKRRQAVGLAPFYARKLAALEDALLAAREALFAAQEGAAADSGSGGDGSGEGTGRPPEGDAAGARRGRSPQRTSPNRAQQGARSGAALEAQGARDQDGEGGGDERLEKVGGALLCR